MYTKNVIVALDTTDLSKIDFLLNKLKQLVSVFKIGMQSYTKFGLDIVKRVQDKGYNVFLDLKFFDIPNTVEKAVQSAMENNIFMLTLHTMGGQEMLKKAVSIKKGNIYPYLLGVTVLTSMDNSDLKEIGITKDIEQFVPYLAKMGKNSGIDGVIASPLEIEKIRNSCGEHFLIVTPGIRKELTTDDQKRTLTPLEAINRGANYIVVGRPVLESSDPVGYIERIFV